MQSVLHISQKLSKITSAMKCGKAEYNAFAKFSFRNIEACCEAVNPYLEEHNCSLIMDDRIQAIGDRYYVESTLKLTCCDTGESILVSAQAREPLNKKGMDDSMVTGMSASYARKRAFAGLFLLDNTEDADSLDNREVSNKSKPTNQTKGEELL